MQSPVQSYECQHPFVTFVTTGNSLPHYWECTNTRPSVCDGSKRYSWKWNIFSKRWGRLQFQHQVASTKANVTFIYKQNEILSDSRHKKSPCRTFHSRFLSLFGEYILTIFWRSAPRPPFPIGHFIQDFLGWITLLMIWSVITKQLVAYPCLDENCPRMHCLEDTFWNFSGGAPPDPPSQ